MSLKFNVDTDAVIALTNRLEKLNRSAFPNAVRGTLNGLALDVKQNTMLQQADHSFINRTKTFFKSGSTVNFAKGFLVESMESEVGFLDKKNNQAIQDLKQQEFGGTIHGRSFIALNNARTSKNVRKLVAKKNQISKIRNIVSTSNVPGKNEKEKFVKSIMFAGKGGLVLSQNILWRVNSLTRARGGKFKLTAIQSYKQNRSVRIRHATHFMKKASEKTMKKADAIYFKEAERQFNRALS